MTKKVRIENADTSGWKVEADIYDRRGDKPDLAADVLVQTVTLHHPAQLAELYIHSSRYIVVREV